MFRAIAVQASDSNPQSPAHGALPEIVHMAAPTAFTAPANVVQKRSGLGSAGVGSYDAPSMFYGGIGLQDPRLVYNSLGASPTARAGVLGWLGGDRIKVVSQVPSTLSTTAIAAAQAAASGVGLTLAAAAGGITVLAAPIVSLPLTNTIPAGTLVIDGLPTQVRFGSSGFNTFYNPQVGVARVVSVTANAGATGGVVLVSGYDFYGAPMSEAITAVAASTVVGKKAFKFIVSAVPAFTDAGHTYAVGTTDIFGLHLAADRFADITAHWANVLLLTATFTGAVATSPATTTTGDVRGTVTAPSASDGTKRLDIYVSPSLSRLATVPMATGLFGTNQA